MISSQNRSNTQSNASSVKNLTRSSTNTQPSTRQTANAKIILTQRPTARRMNQAVSVPKPLNFPSNIPQPMQLPDLNTSPPSAPLSHNAWKKSSAQDDSPTERVDSQLNGTAAAAPLPQKSRVSTASWDRGTLSSHNKTASLKDDPKKKNVKKVESPAHSKSKTTNVATKTNAEKEEKQNTWAAIDADDEMVFDEDLEEMIARDGQIQSNTISETESRTSVPAEPKKRNEKSTPKDQTSEPKKKQKKEKKVEHREADYDQTVLEPTTTQVIPSDYEPPKFDDEDEEKKSEQMKSHHRNVCPVSEVDQEVYVPKMPPNFQPTKIFTEKPNPDEVATIELAKQNELMDKLAEEKRRQKEEEERKRQEEQRAKADAKLKELEARLQKKQKEKEIQHSSANQQQQQQGPSSVSSSETINQGTTSQKRDELHDSRATNSHPTFEKPYNSSYTKRGYTGHYTPRGGEGRVVSGRTRGQQRSNYNQRERSFNNVEGPLASQREIREKTHATRGRGRPMRGQRITYKLVSEGETQKSEEETMKKEETEETLQDVLEEEELNYEMVQKKDDIKKNFKIESHAIERVGNRGGDIMTGSGGIVLIDDQSGIEVDKDAGGWRKQTSKKQKREEAHKDKFVNPSHKKNRNMNQSNRKFAESEKFKPRYGAVGDLPGKVKPETNPANDQLGKEKQLSYTTSNVQKNVEEKLQSAGTNEPKPTQFDQDDGEEPVQFPSHHPSDLSLGISFGTLGSQTNKEENNIGNGSFIPNANKLETENSDTQQHKSSQGSLPYKNTNTPIAAWGPQTFLSYPNQPYLFPMKVPMTPYPPYNALQHGFNPQLLAMQYSNSRQPMMIYPNMIPIPPATTSNLSTKSRPHTSSSSSTLSSSSSSKKNHPRQSPPSSSSSPPTRPASQPASQTTSQPSSQTTLRSTSYLTRKETELNKEKQETRGYQAEVPSLKQQKAQEKKNEQIPETLAMSNDFEKLNIKGGKVSSVEEQSDGTVETNEKTRQEKSTDRAKTFNNYNSSYQYRHHHNRGRGNLKRGGSSNRQGPKTGQKLVKKFVAVDS